MVSINASPVAEPAALVEEARLAVLRSLGLLDAPRNERFERVVDAAQREFGTAIACITLIDADRQWRAAFRGPVVQQDSTVGAICPTAMWSPEPFVVPDTKREPRFATSQYVLGDPHLRFYAAQPLFAPSGEPIGTLCVMDTEAHELDQSQIATLAELGRWAQREIYATVDQPPTPELRERLRPPAPADRYAVISLPAPSAERSDARLYEWAPVDHGLMLGVGGVEDGAGRTALATATVRSVLRGAPADLDPGVALQLAADRLALEVVRLGARPEVFIARLDTGSGRLDHVTLGPSLAVLARADGTVERLTSSVGPTPSVTDADPATVPPRAGLRLRDRIGRPARGRTGSPDVEPDRVPGPSGADGDGRASSRQLVADDTLICLSSEWSEVDAATLDVLADAARSSTLAELRTTVADLQQRQGRAGGCGLVLRRETAG